MRLTEELATELHINESARDESDQEIEQEKFNIVEKDSEFYDVALNDDKDLLLAKQRAYEAKLRSTRLTKIYETEESNYNDQSPIGTFKRPNH